MIDLEAEFERELKEIDFKEIIEAIEIEGDTLGLKGEHRKKFIATGIEIVLTGILCRFAMNMVKKFMEAKE